MHSSASRAANGIISAKRPCEDPNLSFISEARNEPRASAASAGNVIMHSWSLLHYNHGLVVVGQFKSLEARARDERAASPPSSGAPWSPWRKGIRRGRAS